MDTRGITPKSVCGADAERSGEHGRPADQGQPVEPERPGDQESLSHTALAVSRLNGLFLDVSEGLARPVGLTAAWWQVLGAVLAEPLPVSGIARAMGITRQSVQRIADLLVERGLAGYTANPAHRTAKLLAATDAGREAVRRIGPAHAELAQRLSAALGPEGFAETLRVLTRLAEVMAAEADQTMAEG